MRARSWAVRRQVMLAKARRSDFTASSRLSSTVCMSNTVGVWNLRPMPSWAMSASSMVVRSWMPANMASPAVGRVLPVMTSIIVVLPAPLGPMMARISASSMVSESLLSARKPSNTTEMLSR